MVIYDIMAQDQDNFELNTTDLSSLELEAFDINNVSDDLAEEHRRATSFDRNDVKDFTENLSDVSYKMQNFDLLGEDPEDGDFDSEQEPEEDPEDRFGDMDPEDTFEDPEDGVDDILEAGGRYEASGPSVRTSGSKKKRPSGRRGRSRRRFPYLWAVIFIAVLSVATVLIYRILSRPAAPVTENTPSVEVSSLSPEPGEDQTGTDASSAPRDTEFHNDKMGDAVLSHIARALRAGEEAYRKRPPTVELTDANRDDFVNIASCAIDTSTGKIRIETSSEGIPKSDDKYYYLFAMDSFRDSLGENDEYITRIYKDDETQMSCPLNTGSSIDRLYQKYTVAVRLEGEYVPVSTPKYITNPEVLAKHTGVFMNPLSKKGILIDYHKVNSGQLEDLGVRQAAINIRIADILGPSTSSFFPTIYYTYNGKTYSFNGGVLSGFDNTVASLTAKGISTTAILLNSWSSSHISLIHPDARSAGSCPYYMFNGADEAGVELLAAVGSFLADRYSGTGNGRISNWVIANEINARKEWNYLNYTDVSSYSAEYAKAFRVLYTAIRSTSSSARVYISLDQQWDRNLKNNPDYDGRDVLDCFNSYISEHGNIDWGIAYHPYNVPLTTCKTWNSTKYVSHSPGTSIISMQNIEVLINYLHQEPFLDRNGDVRSIMLTELGYTSSGSGTEQLQAAAIAYAYYKVQYYPDIDGLLLNRQTDDGTEIAQGLATGITYQSGGKKLSYNVFKYMDTDERETYTEFAKPLIGISSWNQIIY